jgi:protein-S-isoprenylcysteine O-methyltransferase Ste14
MLISNVLQTLHIAMYEEKILTEEFGEDYSHYKKKVGMLFPR